MVNDVDTTGHPFRGQATCKFEGCTIPADYIEVSIAPHRPCCSNHAMMLIAGGGRTIKLEAEDESLRVLREAQPGVPAGKWGELKQCFRTGRECLDDCRPGTCAGLG